MQDNRISAIILAAGKGTRMNSPLPKVVHPVAGRPMIVRVIEAAKRAGADEVRIIVGYGEQLVRQIVEPLGVTCFKQEKQLGTADAVKAAQPETLDGTVIILNGDHPLIEMDDVKGFLQAFESGHYDLAVISCELKDPASFGRIVRHHGELKTIVEAKDAGKDTLKINEINTGIYVVKAKVLNELLPIIKNNNAQGEYYLTDLVGLCQQAGKKITAIKSNPRVALGVNSQLELAKATKVHFRKKIKALLEQGVIVIDPARTYIEDTVEIGPATIVYPNVYIKGKSRIGSLSIVESNCFITHSQVGASVQIKVGSVLEECVVKDRAIVGPYGRLRPQSEVGEDAHIGNFVELKKVKFGARSKANHLTYLGDAEIGTDVNIGCGTITCNYAVDRKKYKTVIGNNVFVGSDSQLVAPVEVEAGAIIASGSTITKNVPADALAIARAPQVNKEGYAKRLSKANEK